MDEHITFLTQTGVQQFIEQNVKADVNKLILNPPKAYKDQIKEIAAQILARQKAKGKLDMWAQNFELILPPPISIEQASSQATAEYKEELISGDHLIDLTGGMGVDFLALSRQFGSATYVEKDPVIFNAFSHNAKIFKSPTNLVNDDASNYLSKLDGPTKSTLYLDPARRDTQKSKVFKIDDCSPNLLELLPNLRQKADQVLVKYSPLLDIHSVLQDVPFVKELHIVSVRNECKELLILIDFNFKNSPRIICVNLESGHHSYELLPNEETSSPINLSKLKSYLLEPNSSILKAGAFKKIGLDFGLKKLAPNTHLYTSDSLIVDFPGRIFKVVDEVNKKNIRDFASNGKINVVTRNYPLTSNELKKKLKLKDGGDQFLIGYRDKEDSARLIIADRVDASK